MRVWFTFSSSSCSSRPSLLRAFALCAFWLCVLSSGWRGEPASLCSMAGEWERGWWGGPGEVVKNRPRKNQARKKLLAAGAGTKGKSTSFVSLFVCVTTALGAYLLASWVEERWPYAEEDMFIRVPRGAARIACPDVRKKNTFLSVRLTLTPSPHHTTQQP